LTFRDMATGEVLLSGADLVEGGAQAGIDQYTNQAIVQVKLKDAAKFADITGRYVGQPIGIYLDEELITAPVVKQRITGGIATIEGQRDIVEAQELADLLNAGALPVNLVELQAQSVGASLGQRSLELGIWAGIIGGIAVLIFMLVYYRLPGLVANISLLIYTYLLLLLFQLLGVTLTLAGIAAFIFGAGHGGGRQHTHRRTHQGRNPHRQEHSVGVSGRFAARVGDDFGRQHHDHRGGSRDLLYRNGFGARLCHDVDLEHPPQHFDQRLDFPPVVAPVHPRGDRCEAVVLRREGGGNP